MKRLLLGISLAALSVSVAQAADLPVKAALAAIPYRKCGFYYGINAEGGAAECSQCSGRDDSGSRGHRHPGRLRLSDWRKLSFVEGIVDFQNLNAGNQASRSLALCILEQRVGFRPRSCSFCRIWGSMREPTRYPQPCGPFSLPAQLLARCRNYVYGAVNEDDISSSIGIATAVVG